MLYLVFVANEKAPPQPQMRQGGFDEKTLENDHACHLM